MVEVEQVGESKVLMFHTTFSTEVRVVEDDSDPDRLKTDFELIRSVSTLHQLQSKTLVTALTSGHAECVTSVTQDILNRFHGSWLVTPETNASGQVVGCTAVLEQEVLPRG